MQTPIQLYGLGQFGVILDVKPHLLPPEAWSNANNVVFDKNGVRRSAGHEQVFSTMSVTPEFITNVPALGTSFWIYTSLTKAYVYEAGVHTNITRQSVGVDVNYTATAGRQWTGTILGGIPILNNGIDIPQYWPALSSATKLANLAMFVGPGAATLRAKVIRAFGQYLVALNVTEGTAALPQSVYWSHKADPGTLPTSMDYTDPSVDAGRTFLTDVHGGDILDGQMLGDELFIYKEYSTHALRQVATGEVMLPRLVLASSGVLATRCVCSYMDGTRHFVVTADDIITHAGTKETRSLAQDRIRSVFKEIDSTNYVNSFVFENKLTKECWFCYPTIGNTYPNKAARWNYVDDTWSFRDFTGVSMDYGAITDASTDTWDADSQIWDDDSETWQTSSRTQQVFVDRTNAYAMERGFAFGSSTPIAFAERTGISIDGKDRQGNLRASFSSRKLLSRLWPKLSGVAQVTISQGKQEILDGVISWDGGQVFDTATQRFIDSTGEPVNGLLLAVRFESMANDPWELEGQDLYINRLGGL